VYCLGYKVILVIPKGNPPKIGSHLTTDAFEQVICGYIPICHALMVNAVRLIIQQGGINPILFDNKANRNFESIGELQNPLYRVTQSSLLYNAV